MKGWRKYPFLLMIVISGVAYGGKQMISELEQEVSEQKEVVSSPWEDRGTEADSSEGKKVSGSNSSEEKNTVDNGAEEKKESQTVQNQSKENKENQQAQNQPKENKENQPEQNQSKENEEKKFERVEMDYLDDALFIGDSRTSTLYEYAGWTKTDFFVKYGQTVWDVWDSKMEGKTLEQMLTGKKYGKIYIMLGINELGRGTPESFAEQFRSVVERVRQLQPQAVVFVEAIMHVTQGKDEENTYINNQEINARNEKLKGLADNKNIFYIDVNEVMDEPGTGKLKAEYSFDGVHLQVKYIDIWREFLLNHGIKVSADR